jgi:hypothetical protein
VDSESVKGSPLEQSFKRLRDRTYATLDFSSGHPFHQEFVQCFIDYCDEAELWEPSFQIIEGPPDDAGQEHRVWFDPSDACYYKRTHPGFFGLNVVYRDEGDRYAHPLQYLERWVLHNDMFGDAIEWLGCFRETEDRLSILIRQPAIEGIPATDSEIDSFFREVAWRPFEIGGECAYYAPNEAVVISDTHRGNLIKMRDGLLVPIDLRLQRVEGTLRDAVLNFLEDTH